MVDFLLSEALLDASDPTGASYWLLAPIMEYLAWAGVFIGIYSYFDDLIISKVIPWMIGLGGLGVLYTVLTTYSAFSDAGLSLSPLYAVTWLSSFGFAVLVVSRYFKSKQPLRY